MRFKEYKNGGGIDPNYYNRLSEIESNNNPQARSKTSSASGKFQFIKSTWEGLTKKYGLPYNLEDRFDPEKSKKVAELYTQENANYLKSKLGIIPTNTDLYAAHFMGVGGASKLLSTLKQNPNASAYDVASPTQIAANKTIFLRKDGSVKTAKEVYDTLNYKVTKNKPQQEVNTSEVQTQQNEPYQFREIKPTDYYAPKVSQNVSSLDNVQETTNLAEDKAAEIKNRLDQKKAEKAFIEQMIKATQVAYVNPEDYQSKPTFEEPQEHTFQNGGEKNSLWKNIRANRGSGRNPTKQMLEQERKISRKENGGVIPISSQGVYDYPNQEVLVPTQDGKITMKNISYPILGIDEYGNQQMMQPEGEYQFPGKIIHEKPQQFQTGGNIPWFQDAGLFSKKWGESPEDVYNTLTKVPTSLNEQALAYGVPEGQGVYIGEKGNQTYVSPDNILNEVVVKGYKKPSNQIDISKVKSKEEIEIAQKKLIDFGYDLGQYGVKKNGVDGLAGKKTTESLKSYNEIVKYQEEYNKGDKKEKVENFIINKLGKRTYNKRELELFRDSDYLKTRPELMDEDVKQQIEVNKKSKHIDSDYLVISDKNSRGYIFDKNSNIIKTFKTIQGKDTGEESKINSKDWVKANPGKTFTDYINYLGNTNKKYTPSGVFFVGRKDEDYSGLKSNNLFGKALIQSREVLGNLGLSTTNDDRRSKREHSYGDVGLISLKRLSGDGMGEAIHSTGTEERTQNLSGISTTKNRKMSSGCINVGDEDMGFCFDNLEKNTPVFLLREDGVNLSPDVLKFKNANKSERIVANNLYNNYDKLKTEFGKDTDRYINYATGILGNESSFGNMSAYGEVKEALAENQLFRDIIGKKGDASIGAAQIKWSGVAAETKAKLAKFGINNEQDLKDNNKSAIAAMFVFRDKVKANGNTLAGGVKGYLGAIDVDSKKVKNYLSRVKN